MATLKDHQQAMVDLLASGSGIPASASRLAHAMHDVLGILLLQSAARENSADIRALFVLDDATTPGLNDKALAADVEALQVNSPAKWPATAEQRIRELENTNRQLRKTNAKLKQQNQDLRDDIGDMASKLHKLQAPEQAGCRKDDTQGCEHSWNRTDLHGVKQCLRCGETKVENNSVCNHKESVINSRDRTFDCLKCGLKVKWPLGFSPSEVQI